MPPSSAPVKEFATIVDVKEESHYILDPKQALMKFTLGTVGGLLPPHRKRLLA